jgi:hypothetical protein
LPVEVADSLYDFFTQPGRSTMRIKTAAAAFIAMTALAACTRGDVESADTTTVPGIDTTAGMALPTTDTVVKTTITDTLQGEVSRDSAKAKTTKKSPY